MAEADACLKYVYSRLKEDICLPTCVRAYAQTHALNYTHPLNYIPQIQGSSLYNFQASCLDDDDI